MKKMIAVAFGLTILLCNRLVAQENTIKRTSEEMRELFGYCDKPVLVKQLNIAAAVADKIGEIDHWARQQQAAIDANTNEAFATKGELMQEVNKKYKALGLSADQVKTLADPKRIFEISSQACPIITLHPNHVFDTLSPQKALQLYKTKYRKQLIDKLGINGRQADMLMEVEVWKQKETLAIDAIPEADFNRIRKTVTMYEERQKKCRAVDITDDQIDQAYQFFEQNKL